MSQELSQQLSEAIDKEATEFAGENLVDPRPEDVLLINTAMKRGAILAMTVMLGLDKTH